MTYAGPVESDSPIVAVSAGFGHCLALRADGKVWGWGHGSRFSQLPDEQVAPQIIDGIEDVDAIYAGHGDYSLFIRNGKLIEFGFRQKGQLSTFNNIDHVVRVIGSSNYILAIRDDGTLWGTGSYQSPEVGVGLRDATNRFVQLDIEGIIDLTVDRSEVAALREDGTVWRWGYTYFADEWMEYNTPQQDIHFAGVKRIAFGTWLMGLSNDGEVTIVRGNETIPIPELHNIVQIQGVGGLGIGFALDTDGSVWAWGDDWTALGVGPTPAPTLISPQELFRPKPVVISNVQAISSSGFWISALDEGGNVWVWPGSGYGNAIEIYQQNSPILVIQSS